jgi:hypothetical protein
MDWQAGALQSVLFQHQLHGTPDALQAWTRVFGTSPQSFSQATPGAPSSSQAAGVSGMYQVTIVTQPGRTEFTLSSVPSETDPMPLLEQVDAGLMALKGYVLKLMGNQSLARLSIVLQLVKPQKSAREAAAEVCRSAKLESVPDSATDLEFMLNVRRQLKTVSNVEMNRLCKWSAQFQQFIQLQVRPDGISVPAIMQQFHFAGWMIDVNTVPRNMPFAAAEAIQVLDELIEEAQHIRAGGYDAVAGLS